MKIKSPARQGAIAGGSIKEQILAADEKARCFRIQLQPLPLRQRQHDVQLRVLHESVAGINAIKSAAQFFGLDLFNIGHPGNVLHLKSQQYRPAVHHLVVFDVFHQGNWHHMGTARQKDAVPLDFVWGLAARSTIN